MRYLLCAALVVLAVLIVGVLLTIVPVAMVLGFLALASFGTFGRGW